MTPDERMNDHVALWMIGLVSAGVILAVGFLLIGRRPAVGVAHTVSTLPLVNAWLKGTSALLLTVGMVHSAEESNRAQDLHGDGLWRLELLPGLVCHLSLPRGLEALRRPRVDSGVYYPLLISHLILAVLIVPLALTTLYRAWRGQFARHRRIARWTLPVWLYVSVTGVPAHWMLYHFGP